MQPLACITAAILALCYMGLASAGVMPFPDSIAPKIMIISMARPSTSPFSPFYQSKN
jgi:hypothetical protein